jgi:hypothetical protein
MTAVRTRVAGADRRTSTRPTPAHRPPPVPARRRWTVPLVAGASAALLALGVAVAPRLVNLHPGRVCGDDALQAESVAGLANFAGWLQRSGAQGFIGEVGWPSGVDSGRWNALAETWYDAADRMGLPVTAWAAARWPASYPMAVYRSRGGSTLDSAGPQAAVVERHRGDARTARGVALAGGSFGAGEAHPDFSSTQRGRYGYDYSYENAASYRYLAEHGVRLVRLALSWERLQPVPQRPLDPAELQRLHVALDNAARAGIRVVLDLHGYGSYLAGGPAGRRRLLLGSAELPPTALADFWHRLAPAVAAEPALAAFDLLNEPLTLAQRGAAGARQWERTSQQAVDAIRASGATATVLVSGYGQTAPARWGELHPRAWIQDPVGRVAYDAHVYFDSDGSGHYAAGYGAELQRAQAGSPAPCHQLPDLAAAGPALLSGRSG